MIFSAEAKRLRQESLFEKLITEASPVVVEEIVNRLVRENHLAVPIYPRCHELSSTTPEHPSYPAIAQ